MTEPASRETLRESGLGVAHDILVLRHRRHTEELGLVRLPVGMYFMLGDNRDNSADSRYIGFVPRRNVVGRATRVEVSPDPDHHYRPRTHRTMQTLY